MSVWLLDVAWKQVVTPDTGRASTVCIGRTLGLSLKLETEKLCFNCIVGALVSAKRARGSLPLQTSCNILERARQ